MNDWKEDFMNGIDSLFTTQEIRDNGAISTVNINSIIPFQGHTFQVKDDEKMMELVESIREHGVMMPAIAFYNENNQLELVSGHRRMRASELAGLTTIPVIIKNINRDEATVIMGETNLQARDEILPSEKAFTYKVMYSAMKRQGKRTDLTFGPVGQKLNTRKEMAEKVNESEKQIDRYIRLTYLIPELLELVDEKKMGLRPAVELSYISSINQQNIYSFYMDSQEYDENGKLVINGILPSLAQAKLLHKKDGDAELDEDVIAEILEQDKPNQKEKIVLNDKKVFSYKGDLTPLEFERKIIKALDFYEKYKNKFKENEGRI